MQPADFVRKSRPIGDFPADFPGRRGGKPRKADGAPEWGEKNLKKWESAGAPDHAEKNLEKGVDRNGLPWYILYMVS